MFFNRRKKYNGKVAALLPGFGVDLDDAGIMKTLNVLDVAWSNKFNEYEGALLVAYSYLAGLANIDMAETKNLWNRLLKIQEDWTKKGVIRPEIVSKWEETAREKIFGSTIESNEFQFAPNMPDIMKGETIKVYRGGEYFGVFVKDSPSIAERMGDSPFPLKFPYAFVVIDNRSNNPKYFVTLEEGIAGSSFLCVFEENGDHLNLGSDPKWDNENEFLRKSIELSENALNVRFLED